MCFSIQFYVYGHLQEKQSIYWTNNIFIKLNPVVAFMGFWFPKNNLVLNTLFHINAN